MSGHPASAAGPPDATAVRFAYTGSPCAIARVLFREQRAYFASFSHAKKIVAGGRVAVNGAVAKGNTEVREGDSVTFTPSHQVVNIEGAACEWVHSGGPAPLREVVEPHLPTAASLKKALEAGQVRVDGVAVGDAAALITPGMSVAYDAGVARRVVYFEKVEVVHEAAAWAVVVKPAGIHMDASAGCQEGGREGAKSKRSVKTFASILPNNLTPSTAADRLAVPAAVHRLDGPVGGLVAVAKTRSAARTLAGAFAGRDVHKTYTAIVAGRPTSDTGEITEPIDDKPAHTSYRVVKVVPSLRFDHVCVLELHPHTGRFHQLRRHLARALGTPIVGDKTYAPDHEAGVGTGMYLWSSQLDINDPTTGERMTFQSAPPKKFETFLQREARVAAVAEAGDAEGVTSDYVRRLIAEKAARVQQQREQQHAGDGSTAAAASTTAAQTPTAAPLKRTRAASEDDGAVESGDVNPPKRVRPADPTPPEYPSDCPFLAVCDASKAYVAQMWWGLWQRVLMFFGVAPSRRLV